LAQPGEQLLISYGAVVGSAPVAVRRAGLQGSHGFWCRCVGCEDPTRAVRDAAFYGGGEGRRAHAEYRV